MADRYTFQANGPAEVMVVTLIPGARDDSRAIMRMVVEQIQNIPDVDAVHFVKMWNDGFTVEVGDTDASITWGVK